MSEAGKPAPALEADKVSESPPAPVEPPAAPDALPAAAPVEVADGPHSAAKMTAENLKKTLTPDVIKELCEMKGGGRRSKRRRQKKSAKKSKKGGRSRKNSSKNRRKHSRRR